MLRNGMEFYGIEAYGTMELEMKKPHGEGHLHRAGRGITLNRNRDHRESAAENT